MSQQTTTTTMASSCFSSRSKIPKSAAIQRRRFCRGERVEVASLQEGFVGSYYEATVVTDLSRNGYLVQYRTLLKDDMSAPLREVATAAEVRPRPPVVEAADYRLNDVVDAFDKDGWWWGRITGISEHGYLVFFETSGDEIVYPKNRLRVENWILGPIPLKRPYKGRGCLTI